MRVLVVVELLDEVDVVLLVEELVLVDDEVEVLVDEVVLVVVLVVVVVGHRSITVPPPSVVTDGLTQLFSTRACGEPPSGHVPAFERATPEVAGGLGDAGRIERDRLRRRSRVAGELAARQLAGGFPFGSFALGLSGLRHRGRDGRLTVVRLHLTGHLDARACSRFRKCCRELLRDLHLA